MNLEPLSITFKMMPDAQDDESRTLHRIANDVPAKDEVANRIWLRSLRDTTAHFRERAEAINARNEICGNAGSGGWAVVGDEVTQPGEISDGFLRINEPHLSACGGGSSLEVPHDSNQE